MFCCSPGHCRPASRLPLYDSATGILTLTGTASLAAYQTALQQITFDNTGTTPSTATRVIDIVVNDGLPATATRQRPSSQASVVNNSAPVLDLDPNANVRGRPAPPSGRRSRRTADPVADRRRGYLHKKYR